MSLRLRFRYAFAMMIVLILSTSMAEAGRGRRSGNSQFTAVPALESDSSNEVVRYLSRNLGIKNTADYILSQAVWNELMEAAGEARQDRQSWLSTPLSPKARALALSRYFSEFQAATMGEIFRAFAAPSLNNPMISGPAGVGKSHLMKGLAAFLSYGVVPSYLLPELGVPVGRTLESTTTGPYSMQRRALIGGSVYQRASEAPVEITPFPLVVVINNQLLSKDPTAQGEAIASAQQRIQIVLEELYAAARTEFRKSGRRTYFFLEEIATLPPLILQTLKPILDKSGLRNPSDPLASILDPGYGTAGICTDDERQKLSRGDSAIDRRFRDVQLVEPSPEMGFQILQQKVREDYSPNFGLTVRDEALRYIVHMRRFFDNPPEAMPGNIIKALEDFYMWAMHSNNRPESVHLTSELSLSDVQNFMKDRLSLTDLWFEQILPDGTVIPALAGLEACVKRIVKGQDEAVELISQKFTAWARLGFSGTVPTFALGGPSGAGKDTLFAAFNLCLYGHEGGAFQFNLAGQEGFGLTSIITGPPIGNHADDELPLLAQALDRGVSSMVAMNEAQDISSKQMELLKKYLETGEIHPQGRDNRVRHTYFPTWLIGQWGEWLFVDEDGNAITDEDKLTERYNSLTHEDILQAFMQGKRMFGTEFIGTADPRFGEFGAMPFAVTQRILMTGALVILRPVSRLVYPEIIRIKAERFIRDVRITNNLQLTVSEGLIQYIAQVAEASGAGTRGLHSITMDFTLVALSVAGGLGLPLRNIAVNLDVDLSDPAHPTIVATSGGLMANQGPSRQYRLAAPRLRTMKVATCENSLKPAEHTVHDLENNSGLAAQQILPTTQGRRE